MANPNLLNLTSITLENNAAILGTSTFPVALYTCASNDVAKVISLYLANKSSSTRSVTVRVDRGGSDYFLAYEIDMPPESTLQLITKDAPVVLTEADVIEAYASAASSIDAFISVQQME